MRRSLFRAAVLATGGTGGAFWLGEFYCYLESRREQQNQWPAQFVGQDRVAAKAPFDVMIQNGWRRQNLLGTHHFNEDCTKLTRSGELRVQWILTQAPPEHRQVFIERSLDPDVTQQRIATTNEFAKMVVADGSAIPAQETHILSSGRPAVEVDFVNTQFRKNMRTPALPSGATGGGGGGDVVIE